MATDMPKGGAWAGPHHASDPQAEGGEAWLVRVASGATLALPLFLLHGRVIADGLMSMLAVLFLVRSVRARDVSWLRTPWIGVGLAWWGWQWACSLPHGVASWTQAAALVRFLLFAAALEHWVLRPAGLRRWLARLLRWSALYIGLQSLLQFGVGVNLFGYPRSGDGELTGPYEHPRAAPPLVRLLFPAFLPVRALLLLAGVATVLLIGQRMPLLLTLLGLFTTALLLPHLRGFVLTALVLVGMLLATTSVLAPPTFYRLVTKFSTQMADFPDSPYGQIAGRALAIAEAHPIAGGGYDSFRRMCPDPAYFQGFPGAVRSDGWGAAMCVQHPHNHYLEALDNAGVPGLVLFSALVLAWLLQLARGLRRNPDPLRVGLFVGALIHVWPVGSDSAFASMPLSGWFFVILGLGLAEARAYMCRSDA